MHNPSISILGPGDLKKKKKKKILGPGPDVMLIEGFDYIQ